METPKKMKFYFNRYSASLLLLAAMLYVHTQIILIHPILFITWPASTWLIGDIFQSWKKETLRISLIIITFILYTIATMYLVVENTRGIFFNIAAFPNMRYLSYFVLIEACMLFTVDALVYRRATYKNTFTYIGFAAVLPWIAPALVEAIVLTRWWVEGVFYDYTLGKGLGAASLNDILFAYGWINLLISTAFCYLVLVLQSFSRLIRVRGSNKAEKREKERQNKEWHLKAWEDPITLLSAREREEFESNYGQLELKEQKKILRYEVLPRKGIKLVDPEV